MACEKEVQKFNKQLSGSLEVRPTLIHLFLYIKTEHFAVVKFDRSLAERIIKIFAETLVAQTYDNYFQIQKHRDQYVEAAFSVDLEFSMLWVAKYVDAILLEKAKRVRELSLEGLTSMKVGGNEYLKALKSYLRGSKLKYAYIVSV